MEHNNFEETRRKATDEWTRENKQESVYEWRQAKVEVRRDYGRDC